MAEIYDAYSTAVKQGKLVAIATVIAGPGIGRKLLIWPTGETIGHLGSQAMDEQVSNRASELLAVQRTERITVGIGEATNEIFVEIYAPPPRLIMVGAVHIAIPLVTFGNTLGYQTIVLDARSAFATEERFGHASQLLVGWPADTLTKLGIDEGSFVVVLTHDEKIDNPALEIALRSPARYIGALGSKKTHARRVAALKELGVTDEELARLHAPIGLEIGARRPEEIAVSIIAEIVAVSNGAKQ